MTNLVSFGNFAVNQHEIVWMEACIGKDGFYRLFVQFKTVNTPSTFVLRHVPEDQILALFAYFGIKCNETTLDPEITV